MNEKLNGLLVKLFGTADQYRAWQKRRWRQQVRVPNGPLKEPKRGSIREARLRYRNNALELNEMYVARQGEG